ncbi:MAG TPA: tetratricopeptide repeat protein [Aggregatilineaceae bacterium]|nr:tetratricopeptide repeat protein [Aggregatilineaceae bacterium]
MTAQPPASLPDFSPALEGFRADEFRVLTELLLAIPAEHDPAWLTEAPFRLDAPEPRPEPPLPPLPPRWYPRPAREVIDAARASLAPPPRPAVFEGRGAELERALRPLLSGHPMQIRGEAGIGKTTLLAIIANHERTRQRFRRIWWIDRPARLEQTLALTLNLPHLLAEGDPAGRRALLAGQLDDHTLLILDGAQADDPLIDALPRLTDHVLIAVETPPEAPDPDEPPVEDPAGVVTLRALGETAAIEALAQHAEIRDTRRIRGELARLAGALEHHPFALAVAGRLIRYDELTLSELEELLGAMPALSLADSGGEALADAVEAALAAHHARITRPLKVSADALPGDYRKLLAALSLFPLDGAPFAALHAVAKLDSPLTTRRGLLMLAQAGLIQVDHRDRWRASLHPLAQDCAGRMAPEPFYDEGRARLIGWAQRFATTYAAQSPALYRAESALGHALDLAGAAGERKPRGRLLDTLRPYLREYAPELLPPDAALREPELTGERAESARLTAEGLALTDTGEWEAAEEALNQALALRREHDSPHAIAETLVALARLRDAAGDHARAAEYLIEAAEMVFNLGAEPSLSVIRRGLAQVYRHLGRYADALAVLDDAPAAHLERAAILRAQAHYDEAAREITQATGAPPEASAEIFLLAGRPDDALSAIAGQTGAAPALLRAQVHHVRGDVEQAIEGYQLAVEAAGEDSSARAKALRGLGAALALAGRLADARSVLEDALALHRAESPPDTTLLARTLKTLAAVRLAQDDSAAAVEAAREALDLLQRAQTPSDAADAYRTLGSALWQLGDHAGALAAFEGEVEHAQAMPVRNDARIGLALHRVADAYFRTGSPDRAVANYRRALTHLKPSADPHAYFVTQLALHQALIAAERLPAALDVAQEMVELTARRPAFPLRPYGYAQALRARTQIAMERPIRARQSLDEWAHALATRAAEAAADPDPGLRLLALGLAARSLLADGRPALALDLAQAEAGLAARQTPDALPAWAAIRDLGEAYAALGQNEEAILTLEPLLAPEMAAYPATHALAHRLTGEAYRALGEHESARRHLETALVHEPDAHQRGLMHETLAALHLAQERPADAVGSLRASASLIDRAAHPDVAARVLTTLAQTLGGLNRYAEAIGEYEEALVVLREVEHASPAHTAGVLRALGQTHEAQGQLAEAARAYRRALNILERADAPRLARDVLHQLARVTAALGDPGAVQLYEQARDETARWGEPRELGIVLCELADVHRDAGRLPLALQNYQAALEQQPAESFPRERVNTLRNLGRAFRLAERYDEARQTWTEALDLSRRLPDHSPLEMALTYHAIAEAHRSQAQWDLAEKTYREALEHHEPRSVAAAATWRALGQTLHAMGRPADALEPLRRALEIEKIQPHQSNARLVQTLQALAEANETAGDLKAALARYHEALVYMDRALQPVAYAGTLRLLGRLYCENNQHRQAHTALDEALAIENSLSPRSDERISATLQAIADTYRAENDLEKAAEFYQKVTVYANLARPASQNLKETLDELERRRATLQAAQQSLALLDRSDNANLKDVTFIYALIARSHAGLKQPDKSVEAIYELLDVLEARQADLKRDDPEPDQRALAWLATAAHAQDEDDLPSARLACRSALESVQNPNLRWVIEQVQLSLA